MEAHLTELAQHCLVALDRFLVSKGFKLIDLFRRRDIQRDGDGMVDAGELESIIASCEGISPVPSREELDAVVTLLDNDGNGKLDIAELDEALLVARSRARGNTGASALRAWKAEDAELMPRKARLPQK